MKKIKLFMLTSVLLGITLSSCSKPSDPWKDVSLEKGLNFITKTFDREKHETIDIKISEYGPGNSVGIFARDSEPGSKKGAIKRKAIKEEIDLYSFNIEDFKSAGEYNVFLFDKNEDIVRDYDVIKILDTDKNNYQAKDGTFTSQKEGDKLISSLTINTEKDATLTYSLYWSKDGVRLSDYTAIEVFTSNQKEITINFQKNMFVPSEANQIEIAVKEGRSESIYVSIDNTLKLEESILQNTMQVFSDIHIESKYTCSNYNSHFVSNLNYIKNNYPTTNGIVCVGDSANSGNENNYKLFYEYVDSVFETRPTVYPVLGNHEVQYYDDYNEAIAQYTKSTGMPGAYFTFEIAGFKCFALGSEDTSTHGYMSNEQFAWLETEMNKCSKTDKIMVFMHQGVYNTVSGTLPNHGWHGFRTQTEKLRTLFNKFPNAFVFSGHTHQSIDCDQTCNFGYGEAANYVNTGSSAYVLDDNRDETYGSNGYFLEVYEDYLVLKGRNAIENKWIAAAQFVVPFNK